MQHILLVEDSEDYRKIVRRTLGHHTITATTSVDEALTILRNRKFDLVLLDINLPGKSGYSLLSELQSDPRIAPIPVLCLTGKTDVTDKVTAFSLGADDYIVKPFDPIELKARVDGKMGKVVRLRAKEDLLRVGELEIDQLSHRVAIVSDTGRREIPVTQTEYKLLCCLIRRPDQVLTRDQLLVQGWGDDADVLDRVVDVHLCALRKKLGKHGRCLQAVPGVGYRFALEKDTGHAA